MDFKYSINAESSRYYETRYADLTLNFVPFECELQYRVQTLFCSPHLLMYNIRSGTCSY